MVSCSQKISIVRNTSLWILKNSLGTIIISSDAQMGFFQVVFPLNRLPLSPDNFGIVNVFNIFWKVVNLVASDNPLHLLDSRKSQGVL